MICPVCKNETNYVICNCGTNVHWYNKYIVNPYKVCYNSVLFVENTTENITEETDDEYEERIYNDLIKRGIITKQC